MHALDILGDPVRRRILELIADGEASAGGIAAVISREFGISQPAVSQHLRVLREHGFASVRAEGTRRLYAVDPQGLQQASEWLTPFERFWRGPFAALSTELARGKRERRLSAERAAASPPPRGDAAARTAGPSHDDRADSRNGTSADSGNESNSSSKDSYDDNGNNDSKE
ncbi:ArsR/SmtB family transcription factor [Leucobacter tenebrionis]|uniref:ArsR/SmtB family transcription factor n=1 Tax=Leucobacter tenebrionis TaxID=2873270 RepID=UPI002106B9C0|nr:metalloregulator ArsR/SmtB family transcription factor [Leucobacter tenebrionis]